MKQLGQGNAVQETRFHRPSTPALLASSCTGPASTGHILEENTLCGACFGSTEVLRTWEHGCDHLEHEVRRKQHLRRLRHTWKRIEKLSLGLCELRRHWLRDVAWLAEEALDEHLLQCMSWQLGASTLKFRRLDELPSPHLQVSGLGGCQPNAASR